MTPHSSGPVLGASHTTASIRFQSLVQAVSLVRHDLVNNFLVANRAVRWPWRGQLNQASTGHSRSHMMRFETHPKYSPPIKCSHRTNGHKQAGLGLVCPLANNFPGSVQPATPVGAKSSPPTSSLRRPNIGKATTAQPSPCLPEPRRPASSTFILYPR